MSAIQKLLTDHIDIWTAAETEKKFGRGRSSGNAGSVYGIKKLRELILELAVRGKLVPQDPNDEPASELLKRIQAEKAKLVAEGKIKQAKPLPPIEDDEKSFDLPDGWTWVRLGEVCSYIQRGKGPTYTDNSEFLVISQKCVRWTGLDLTQARFIDPESVAKYEAIRFLCEGDILWNSTGTGTIGRACWVPSLLNQQVLVADSHVTVVRPIGLWNVFLWRWIQSPSVQSQIEGVASGTTNQIELNTSTVISHLLPLPPLPEQHRIVAKVDELMALCDQLENQHSNAAEAHEKLVNHLLGTLTQSPVRGEPVEPHPSTSSGRTEFEDNWQRIAAHFDTLFTTEASIDALKQTLLQLAVMGKLVPQDPNDEPASELLKRIQAEKAKLVAEGKIKKDKALHPFDKDETPFDLPKGWEWVRFAELTTKITDGTHHTPSYVKSGIPFLSVKDMSSGVIDFSSTRFISVDEHNLLSKRCNPEYGDLLLTKVGTTGIPVVIVTDITFSIFVSVALIKAPWKLINVEYLRCLISSPFVKKQSDEGTEGIGNKNLVLRKIENFVLVIPPLAEQNRIVAKVDELMALCDQLKSRITQAKQLQQKLANVLVEQAVSQ